MPAIPRDCPDLEAVFFSGEEALADGLANWLGERFEDDERLVALEVDLSGVELVGTCAWEWLTRSVVTPNRIRRQWSLQ